MNRMSLVALKRCSYARSSLADFLEQTAPYLGIDEGLQGKKVLLKPNLISSRGPSLACTDHRFIISVARWFVEHGATVGIGDSPAFGTAGGVLRHITASTELDRLGVRVVEFASPTAVVLAGGVRIGVAAEALDCDLMVNLPKIKAHNQMYMTLAVKNFFGIIKGIQKSMLHMRQGASHRRFARIILDLLAVLPEHITLADGIEVMHIAGPLRGKPLALQCVAASRNPLAVDTAFLDALELPPEKCPLWVEAKARGYLGVNTSEIQFPLLSPEAWHGSGFRAPDLLSPIRFNPLRFLYGRLKRIVLAIRS